MTKAKLDEYLTRAESCLKLLLRANRSETIISLVKTIDLHCDAILADTTAYTWEDDSGFKRNRRALEIKLDAHLAETRFYVFDDTESTKFDASDND